MASDVADNTVPVSRADEKPRAFFGVLATRRDATFGRPATVESSRRSARRPVESPRLADCNARRRLSLYASIPDSMFPLRASVDGCAAGEPFEACILRGTGATASFAQPSNTAHAHPHIIETSHVLDMRPPGFSKPLAFGLWGWAREFVVAFARWGNACPGRKRNQLITYM